MYGIERFTAASLDPKMMALTHFPIQRAQQAIGSLGDAYPAAPLCAIGMGTVVGLTSWSGTAEMRASFDRGLVDLALDPKQFGRIEGREQRQRDVRVAQPQKQQGAGIVKGGSAL